MSNEKTIYQYSAKISTNSHGEVMVEVQVNSDFISQVKREAPELYSHIVEELSAYGCKIADPGTLDTEIDTTAKGDPLLKLSGKGTEIVQTYLQNVATLHKKEAESQI